MTTEAERERLGRIAYEAECAYVRESHPGYLPILWDERAFANREVYGRMAEAVAAEVRTQERAKVAALVSQAEDDAADDPGDSETWAYLDGLRAALAALVALGAGEDG